MLRRRMDELREETDVRMSATEGFLKELAEIGWAPGADEGRENGK